MTDVGGSMTTAGRVHPQEGMEAAGRKEDTGNGQSVGKTGKLPRTAIAWKLRKVTSKGEWSATT
jgi:hypothetical protein